MLQAVTFDYWDTLVVGRLDELREGRVDVIAGLLTDGGLAAERTAIVTAYDIAFETFKDAWGRQRQFGHRDAAARLLQELGVEPPAALHDEICRAMISGTGALHLTPNCAEMLRDLKGRGVRLGIICDVGLTPAAQLRLELARHDVLELFDHTSFSDEVGHYKPSGQIFAHAHAGLGVDDPAAAAHVGDLCRTDVQGARDRGSVAVRYAGVFDDDSGEAVAHHVIHDHADLTAVLDLPVR